MTAGTVITLAAMYLLPLLTLVWLYKKNPAWAFIAVIVIVVIFGILGEVGTSEFGAGPPDVY